MVIFAMQNNYRTKAKCFLQKLIPCRDGPIQVWKQGKDENMQEDHPTME